MKNNSKTFASTPQSPGIFSNMQELLLCINNDVCYSIGNTEKLQLTLISAICCITVELN